MIVSTACYMIFLLFCKRRRRVAHSSSFVFVEENNSIFISHVKTFYVQLQVELCNHAINAIKSYVFEP